MHKIYTKILISFIISIFMLHGYIQSTFALYDPLSRPNNMMGIHILFNSELGESAEFVNSKGGEWGYVTIPIQMGDYDLIKWQSFMDEARSKKVIPIIRLVTDPYWANTHVWRKPQTDDIIDMANFLNSLVWPTENRYVIVFNEMNRYDEWGGQAPNPQEYADILDTTINIFKERSQDFYMIMGGLDNAAPNEIGKYMDSYVYLQKMAEYKPEVFKKMDAFSSHSYPNPGFSMPPSDNLPEGTSTYKFEYDFIANIAGQKKPVFITETGWDNTKVSDETIAQYYKETFENIWGKDKDKIVAVTPFLLRSHGGFDQFSFIKNEQKTPYYTVLYNLPKIAGNPVLVAPPQQNTNLALAYHEISLSTQQAAPLQQDMSFALKEYFKTVLGL